ncbi:MAG: DUF308 domain-containing protein [Planctomycetaceae bacterium]
MDLTHHHGPIANLKARFIWLGIALAALGAVAIAAPWIPALTVDFLVAAALIAAGATQLATAAGTASWRGFWLTVLCGTLSLVAGAAMLAFPGEGVRALTFFLGLLLLFEAAAKTAAAFSLPRDFPWGWILLDGIVTAVLGGMLVMSRIDQAGIYLGLLIGINLLVSGGSFLGAGLWLKERIG